MIIDGLGIADGRGRTSFAVGMDLQAIDVIMLTPKMDHQ